MGLFLHGVRAASRTLSAYGAAALVGGRQRALICAAIGLAVSGCVGRGGSVPYDVSNFGPPDAAAQGIPAADQRIGPLDKMRITVFQAEELSGEFTVAPDGQIQFPLLGPIAAQGLTTHELSQQIGAQLRERYMRSPSVTVAFEEQASQSVTVDGAVRKPGTVNVRGTTSLIRAIAAVEGTSEDANPARVVVFRTINNQRMAAAFDLRAIRRAEAADPTIYGNDVIVVDGSRTRSILRDIATSFPALGIFVPLIR